MKICYIFGSMPCPDTLPQITKEDMVIAADGGYLHCINKNITPDLTVGDFDSLTDIKPQGEVIYHNPIKNDTDMKLAVDEGIKAGYEKFVIFGGVGGRTDHFIANLSLLVYISKKGKKAVMCSDNETFTAVTNDKLKLSKDRKDYISVFSADTTVSGVTLSNLKYTLKDATLTNDFALGVSNEFIGESAEISVEKGTLIITLQGTDFEDLLK